MNVVRIGTDLIEIARIELMLEKHGNTFINRVYTKQEIEYCSNRAAASQHFAGRWAAKEAVLKVLGTGWARGIQWTEIQVVLLASGEPLVELSGKALEVARESNIDQILLSISHTKQFAIAYAMGLSGPTSSN